MPERSAKPRRRMLAGAAGLSAAAGTAWLERESLLRRACSASGADGAGNARTRAGAAYLHAFPHEADVARLRRSLRSALRCATDLAGGFPPAELCARLDARIRDDFAEHATASLDGWLLSRTELRLCALEYLDSRLATGGERRVPAESHGEPR